MKQAVWDRSLAHPHHPWKQPARHLAFVFRLEYFFMFWFALAGPCCVLIMACTCYWRLRFEDLRLKMTYDPTEIVLISDYKAPTGAAKGSLTLPASMYVLLHVPAHFACPFVSRTEHAFPDTPPAPVTTVFASAQARDGDQGHRPAFERCARRQRRGDGGRPAASQRHCTGELIPWVRGKVRESPS